MLIKKKLSTSGQWLQEKANDSLGGGGGGVIPDRPGRALTTAPRYTFMVYFNFHGTKYHLLPLTMAMGAACHDKVTFSSKIVTYISDSITEVCYMVCLRYTSV